MTVTLTALIGRINRKLAKENEVLKKTRGARAYSDLGDYYILDRHRNLIVDFRIDPEDKARELGVLYHGETVA